MVRAAHVVLVACLLAGCLGARSPAGASDDATEQEEAAPLLLGNDTTDHARGPAAPATVGWRQLPAVEVATHELVLDVAAAPPATPVGGNAVNAGQSNSRATQPLQNVTFVQAELVWRTESPLAERMWLWARGDEGGPRPQFHVESRGPSVLVLGFDAGPLSGSRFVSMFIAPDRHPDVGLGVASDQALTLHVAVFRGFLPPTDWRYTEAGLPQVPANVTPVLVPDVVGPPRTVISEHCVSLSAGAAGQHGQLGVVCGSASVEHVLDQGTSMAQVECEWAAAQPLAERLRVKLETWVPPPYSVSAPNVLWQGTVTGPSILVVQIAAVAFDGAGSLQVRLSADTSMAGVAANQPVECATTFFHGTEPPAGWTYMRDGELVGT